MNIKALTIVFALPFIISGCSNFTLFPSVYRTEIHQGNIVEQEMVDQLKLGMTKAQVRFVLGTPLIADTFDQDRWDYYHSIKNRGDKTTSETFSVLFEGDRLSSFEGDLTPQNNTEEPAAP